jgi:glutathione synthase/RimK-type ligase-like ATP-grasp enzyme
MSLPKAQSRQDVVDVFLEQNNQVCVNKKEAARRCENKLNQLIVAKQTGFDVPDTLVTAELDEVHVWSRNHAALIIKNMRAEPGEQTEVFRLDQNLLRHSIGDDHPMIYQKYIDGEKHYRIVTFGSRVYAFYHRNSNIDGRVGSREDVRPISCNATVERLINGFMANMGLAMGVYDFKEDVSGKLYFLECNQQGQLAYLDPLTGSRLLFDLAEFFISRSLPGRV